LLNEFAAALDGWEWDVALLQEVPPWWPGMLAQGAHWCVRRTSRTLGPAAVQGDLRARSGVLKANGGGSNAILVRQGPVLERGRLSDHPPVRVSF
jgi:hypothetical protein